MSALGALAVVVLIAVIVSAGYRAGSRCSWTGLIPVPPAAVAALVLVPSPRPASLALAVVVVLAVVSGLLDARAGRDALGELAARYRPRRPGAEHLPVIRRQGR